MTLDTYVQGSTFAATSSAGGVGASFVGRFLAATLPPSRLSRVALRLVTHGVGRACTAHHVGGAPKSLRPGCHLASSRLQYGVDGTHTVHAVVAIWGYRAGLPGVNVGSPVRGPISWFCPPLIGGKLFDPSRPESGLVEILGECDADPILTVVETKLRRAVEGCWL
jgi:hypothetical protein